MHFVFRADRHSQELKKLQKIAQPDRYIYIQIHLQIFWKHESIIQVYFSIKKNRKQRHTCNAVSHQCPTYSGIPMALNYEYLIRLATFILFNSNTAECLSVHWGNKCWVLQQPCLNEFTSSETLHVARCSVFHACWVTLLHHDPSSCKTTGTVSTVMTALAPGQATSASLQRFCFPSHYLPPCFSTMQILIASVKWYLKYPFSILLDWKQVWGKGKQFSVILLEGFNFNTRYYLK